MLLLASVLLHAPSTFSSFFSIQIVTHLCSQQLGGVAVSTTAPAPPLVLREEHHSFIVFAHFVIHEHAFLTIGHLNEKEETHYSKKTLSGIANK